MLAEPDTTVTVYGYGPSTVDDLGDDLADSTPTAVGVPASIAETSDAATGASSDRPHTIRTASIRLPAGTQLAAGGRLWDEQADVMWLVDSVAQPRSPYQTVDLHAVAHRVTSS